MGKVAINHVRELHLLLGEMIFWKKLGIYPKTVLLVIGPFPVNEDIFGYSVSINILFKSLNTLCYGGFTRYESIRKLRNSHANFYGASF